MPVAQLDRVPGYEPGGRRFESCQARQFHSACVEDSNPQLFMKDIDSGYMSEAIKEAVKAFEADEVPVGAIIVHNGRIIAKAHNQIKLLKDPTAHAEMIAITQAAAHLQSERLLDVTLYSTVEPCSMCAGAMVLGRIKRLVYGAEDPKTGAAGSVVNIVNNKTLNHKIDVTKGVLAEQSASILKEFFSRKRDTLNR